MEQLALISHGNSQFDDDLWKLLGELTNESAFAPFSTPYDNEGLDYFVFLPTFVYCGADIETWSYEDSEVVGGFNIKVKDKQKFLNRLKVEFRKRYFLPATDKQMKYLTALIKELSELENTSDLIKHHKIKLDLDLFVSKSEAGRLIGFLSIFNEAIKESDYEYLTSESYDIESVDQLLEIELNIK